MIIGKPRFLHGRFRELYRCRICLTPKTMIINKKKIVGGTLLRFHLSNNRWTIQFTATGFSIAEALITSKSLLKDFWFLLRLQNKSPSSDLVGSYQMLGPMISDGIIFRVGPIKIYISNPIEMGKFLYIAAIKGRAIADPALNA